MLGHSQPRCTLHSLGINLNLGSLRWFCNVCAERKRCKTGAQGIHPNKHALNPGIIVG